VVWAALTHTEGGLLSGGRNEAGTHAIRQKYGDKFSRSAAHKCNPIFDAECTLRLVRARLEQVYCARQLVPRAPNAQASVFASPLTTLIH